MLQDVPLPAGTIDVIISNCVINLSIDKPSARREPRVRRPGGRIGISDVVADNDLSPEKRAERGSYLGFIADALSFSEFEDGPKAAGFVDISITSTDEPLPWIHSAIIKATRGPATSSDEAATAHREPPLVQGSCC